MNKKIILVLSIILVGGAFWWYQFGGAYILFPKGSGANQIVQVTESGDRKMIHNLVFGYDISIPKSWRLQSGGDAIITILDAADAKDSLYGGVAFTIYQTDQSDPTAFFKQKLNFNNDIKVKVSRLPSITVNNIAVPVAKVDYRTSYFPSNGEIEYIYQIKQGDKFLSLVVMSLDEKNILKYSESEIKNMVAELMK